MSEENVYLHFNKEVKVDNFTVFNCNPNDLVAYHWKAYLQEK